MASKSIFETTYLNGLKLKNRLFRSATWDGLAAPDGSLNDEIYRIYEMLAKGGVGTIVTGLTDISQHDQALSGNMRLYSDKVIPDYSYLVSRVHQYDCNIFPQLNLNHYMAIDEKTGACCRKELDDFTEEDFKRLLSLYGGAALRTKNCGFDGIQIHGAFNWFLDRSINPKYNHRTDAFGGSPKRRTKLFIEVLNTVKNAAPELPVITKLGFYSSPDDRDAIEQYITTCKLLAENGIDAIEISENWHILGRAEAKEEAAFLPLARAVRDAVDIPLILVGRHRHIEEMERLIIDEGMDYLSMSRGLIREPDLPGRWERGSREPAKCISCDGCFKTYGKQCRFNV